MQLPAMLWSSDTSNFAAMLLSARNVESKDWGWRCFSAAE
jgi:hypothetical protein